MLLVAILQYLPFSVFRVVVVVECTMNSLGICFISRKIIHLFDKLTRFGRYVGNVAIQADEDTVWNAHRPRSPFTGNGRSAERGSHGTIRNLNSPTKQHSASLYHLRHLNAQPLLIIDHP
jgi:hypothetical protein